MRKLLILLVVTSIAACSSSGDDSGDDVSIGSCSAEGQKQFVLDAMRAWYFWADALPADVDLGQFATASDLLAYLTTFSPDDGSGLPLDRFSFINSAAADQAFFGAGQYQGFGFSSRFVDAGEAVVDDLRLTRVFVDSPAYRGGLRRGQRILMLDGRTIAQIQSAEGVGAVLTMPSLEFTMRDTDGGEFTVTIEQDVVTIDPVPLYRVIDAGGGRNVGYLGLESFISTADAQMDDAFGDFVDAGVNDLILDMRYNGGGLVSTAELLGDFLGGDVAENLVFSRTVFNDQRAGANDSTELFERRLNSLSLSRLIVIGSDLTASASEIVTNGMEPHVDVTIIGGDTFGKPVGQVGLGFCDQILRPTAFQTLNANDFGDFFDGLPADCIVPDDLDVAAGDDADPNVQAALTVFETGACPVSAVPQAQYARVGESEAPPEMHRPPHRVYLDAY